MPNAATKSDLNRLNVKIDSKIDKAVSRLDKRIDSVASNLEKRIDAVASNLGKRIDALDVRADTADKKIDALAKTVLKIDQRLETVETTMATKDDIQRVLNHIDAFAGQIHDYARKAVVHDYRLNQVEPHLVDHEKRITALENPNL